MHLPLCIALRQKCSSCCLVLRGIQGKMIPGIIPKDKSRIQFLHFVIQHVHGIVQQKIVLVTDRYPDLALQPLLQCRPVVAQISTDIIGLPVLKTSLVVSVNFGCATTWSQVSVNDALTSFVSLAFSGKEYRLPGLSAIALPPRFLSQTA